LNKIDDCIAPEHWECEQPNEVSKTNAKKIIKIFYDAFTWEPSSMGASIEEGIFFKYSLNKFSDRALIIETYNTGDIGILMNQDKIIIFNMDIHNLDMFKKFYTIARL